MGMAGAMAASESPLALPGDLAGLASPLLGYEHSINDAIGGPLLLRWTLPGGIACGGVTQKFLSC